MNRVILAIISPENYSDVVLNAAKHFAEANCCTINVLTLQPKKADAKIRSKDMKTLTVLSKNSGCDIKIIYTDYPITSVINYVNKIKPTRIFWGGGAGYCKKASTFSTFLKGFPISVIGKNGLEISINTPAIVNNDITAI